MSFYLTVTHPKDAYEMINSVDPASRAVWSQSTFLLRLVCPNTQGHYGNITAGWLCLQIWHLTRYNSVNDPSSEIMVLILQTPSGAWCLIFGQTLHLLPYFMCANSKALARLRRCTGSSEPSLVAHVISTNISWAGWNGSLHLHCLLFFNWIFNVGLIGDLLCRLIGDSNPCTK